VILGRGICRGGVCRKSIYGLIGEDDVNIGAKCEVCYQTELHVAMEGLSNFRKIPFFLNYSFIV
jgi:hypothetical protein